MIGKISFKAVPKNSRRWSWGDVGGQNVPKAASSHQKCTITNSGQSCTSDHKLRGWRRPETAAVGIGDALHVVGKVPWRQTMQALLSDKIVFITSTSIPHHSWPPLNHFWTRPCLVNQLMVPCQLSCLWISTRADHETHGKQNLKVDCNRSTNQTLAVSATGNKKLRFF